MYQPAKNIVLNILKPKNCRQRVIWVIIQLWRWCRSEYIWRFVKFFVPQWYPMWLVGVSTFVNFHGDHFSMQYLPPVGLGRSSESFFHHDSGVRMIQFYEFCNFLRPHGTLGGWKVSQPSKFFMGIISVCHTCHQGAWEGHPSHFSIIRVVSERTNFMIFAIFRVPMIL